MAGYFPRLADAELASRLAASGAVLIEGPRACGKTETARQQAASEVLLDVDDNARRAMDIVSRDPENVGRLLRSLARNVATTVSAGTLAADAGGAEGPLDADTVRSYLRALARLMVIEEQPAWSPGLRSRSLLRKSPKRHFVDPSVAVAALGASPDRLLRELDFLGFLFESMVYRDVSVYARARDAQVYHYRDNTDLEVDLVVQARAGPWCAFEVRLGGGQVDAAADALLRFRDRLDLTAVGEPGALAVVVGSGYGYRREDGVCVIPVGAFGP